MRYHYCYGQEISLFDKEKATIVTIGFIYSEIDNYKTYLTKIYKSKNFYLLFAI